MAASNKIDPKTGKSWKQLFEEQKKKNELPPERDYEAEYKKELSKSKDKGNIVVEKKDGKPEIKTVKPKDKLNKKKDALDERENDFDLKDGEDYVKFKPSHGYMAKSRVNERDMTVQKTFFYERITDNKIFTWTEAEAYLMTEKSNHAVYLKQLGCSDGSVYTEYIRNCGIKPGDTIRRADAEDILRKARDAEFKAAKGHFQKPKDQSVHFDESYPVELRNQFVPPKSNT